MTAYKASTLFFVLASSCFCLSATPITRSRCGNITSARTGWNTYADEQSGQCYMLVDNEMHWEEAHIHCSNTRGPTGTAGTLASFDTKSSLSNVRQWLRDINWYRNGVWIGAKRCTSSQNGFCWVDNSPLSRFLVMRDFWGPGEPTRTVGFLFDADCVQLRQLSNWRSYTMPCHASQFHYSFICQFPMTGGDVKPEPTTTTTTQMTTTELTTTVPETTTTTTQDADPGAMMGGNTGSSSTTTHNGTHISMLLIGLLVGFGAALIIAIIVLLVVWRRFRAPPPAQVQVVLTPAPAPKEKKYFDEEIEDTIAYNRKVESMMPKQTTASLSSFNNGNERTPPPAYRPAVAPRRNNAPVAVIRTDDVNNRTILAVRDGGSNENVYSASPVARC